jgi:5'-3' exoribonuclease 2
MVVNRSAVFQANEANKSAAAALKSQLLGGKAEPPITPQKATNGDIDEDAPPASHEDPGKSSTNKTPESALGKRKADLIDDDAGTPGRDTPVAPATPTTPSDAPDTVRLWEEGYADRYYEQKFSADPRDLEFRHKVARAYVEGLAWVLLYYFQGCPSWTWYYPYHYAPFAADFVDIKDMTISFDRGTPFRPFEQLMGVLPAASRHTIPEPFHELMTNESSDIIDFYPEDFPIDLNGKKFAWQGVALLPFIDAERLLKAMATKYPMLSKEDAARNEVGRDVLLISDGHPLYDDVTKRLYSKRGEPEFKLNSRISEGLAGKVEKNELQVPRTSLVCPLVDCGLPDLDDDRSLRYVHRAPLDALVKVNVG